MNSKDSVVATSTEKPASFLSDLLLSREEYLNRSGKSGNVLLKTDSVSRTYSNSRVNGTSLIILAALSASEERGPIFFGPAFKKGIEALKANNFGNPGWARLEKKWKRGENRSASPALKLSPVLSALRRELDLGTIIGFSADKIGDSDTRKVFGFSY